MSFHFQVYIGLCLILAGVKNAYACLDLFKNALSRGKCVSKPVIQSSYLALPWCNTRKRNRNKPQSV